MRKAIVLNQPPSDPTKRDPTLPKSGMTRNVETVQEHRARLIRERRRPLTPDEEKEVFGE